MSTKEIAKYVSRYLGRPVIAWTKLGILLIMKSSHENEFEADEFAYDLGYGNELCALLSTIKGTPSTGLFANLASSHPDNELRIQRLQELG